LSHVQLPICGVVLRSTGAFQRIPSAVSASLWCLQSSSNNHQLHPQLSQLLQAMSPQHGMLSFSSKLPQRSHHLYPQTKSNNSQWLCSHPQGKRFRDLAMDQRGDIESKSCLRQLPHPSRIRQAFPPGDKKKATRKKDRHPARPGAPYSRPDRTGEPYSPPDSTGEAYSLTTPQPTSFITTSPPSDAEWQLVGSLVDSYNFKSNGLVKKTISVTVQGVTHPLFLIIIWTM
jgi:Gti1/Pac2 family